MSAGDYVVLLHGLGRNAYSMRRIERFLQKQGYRVLNIDYPSTKLTIEQIVEQYVTPKIKGYCIEPHNKIHFVTHSMGGILVRKYLSHYKPMNLGKVVMLAPPNKGSIIAEKLKKCFLFRWICGPAGQQLGIKGKSLPLELPDADFHLGVIAGDYQFIGLGAFWLPGPNDGTVTVSSTKIQGMKDFCLVHRSHTFIMSAPEVLEYIHTFIKLGHFDKVRERVK